MRPSAFTEGDLQHRELSLSLETAQQGWAGGGGEWQTGSDSRQAAPRPGSASCALPTLMPSHYLCPTPGPPPVGLPDVQGVRVRDASLLRLLL